jgi:drug/metabolite transporter (DMT)-like permease
MAETEARPSSRSLGLILGLVATILFSGSLPASREAVADLSPWFVTAARAFIAGAVAIGLIAIRRPAFPHRQVGHLVVIALCLIVGFPAALAVASTTVPASHGAVVLGLLPLATAIAAVPLAGERPSLAFWALSILGALIVAVYALRGGDTDIATGDLYLAFAVFLTGVGYTLSGMMSRTLPGWEVIAWALVFTFPLALVAVIVLWPPDVGTVHWRAWVALLYAGVVVQFVAYAMWNAALAIGGVARVAQLQVLQPFFTIVIAALILGEAVDAETVIFAAAIVIVVALGRRTTIRERPGAAG